MKMEPSRPKDSTHPNKLEQAADGDRVKKDRAERKKKKPKTQTWFDVVKGLEVKDELETTNLDKRGNESGIAYSVEMFDSEDLNQLKAKRTRRQRKSTPT